MSKKLIYLSGMIDGINNEEANEWRKFAKNYLKEYDFDAYNPLEMPHDETTTSNETFNNDIFYLNKSDIVLVNLNLPETIKNKDIPFFTIGEIFLAHNKQKPVIAYTNCLKGRCGFDSTITKSLSNLEECLEYIVRNY